MKLKINDVVEIPSGEIGLIESVGFSTIWVSVDGELKSFQPEELKMPKTVKSYDGETDVIIKAHRQSLKNWPLNFRAVIDDNGNAALVGATYSINQCGCEIIGNGTLQFPLSIKFCKKHSK